MWRTDTRLWWTRRSCGRLERCRVPKFYRNMTLSFSNANWEACFHRPTPGGDDFLFGFDWGSIATGACRHVWMDPKHYTSYCEGMYCKGWIISGSILQQRHELTSGEKNGKIDCQQRASKDAIVTCARAFLKICQFGVKRIHVVQNSCKSSWQLPTLSRS